MINLLKCDMPCVNCFVLLSCPTVVQTQMQGGEMKPHPLSTPTDSELPTEPSGPVWTAYSDGYFEGEFTAPFSDLEEEREEGEGETTSSGSSETASLEDNPSVNDEKLPQIVVNIQPKIKERWVDDSNGQLAEGQQHLLPKSVESESPLSVSSTGSPEHGASTGGSQLERLIVCMYWLNLISIDFDILFRSGRGMIYVYLGSAPAYCLSHKLQQCEWLVSVLEQL